MYLASVVVSSKDPGVNIGIILSIQFESDIGNALLHFFEFWRRELYVCMVWRHTNTVAKEAIRFDKQHHGHGDMNAWRGLKLALAAVEGAWFD